VFFSTVNSVLDGVLALLGKDDPDDEEDEESAESEEDEGSVSEEDSRGIGGRVVSGMPDADRLGGTITDVLDELSSGPEAAEIADETDAEESSSSTAGQQLGEIVGQRLGEMITQALGSSDNEETS
jgi:hypothetical protein